MKAFTINEMETIFEIGRQMQYWYDEAEIDIEDSKAAFMLALGLALEFEKNYADTENYYEDIDNFMKKKFEDKIG